MEGLLALLGVLLFVLMYYLNPRPLAVVVGWLLENVTPKGHIHKWKYNTITVEIKDSNDRVVVVPHRVCKKCGQTQYRTMRPKLNGIDTNVWKNYKGKLQLKRL